LNIAADWYDKLPQALGGAVAQALFKQEIDDFQVDEVVNWQCSGAGEHLCLYVAKRGITTHEVVRRLAAVAGISSRQISYAGLKDKQGHCRQWLSLHLPGQPDPDFSLIEDDTLRIEQQHRHHRKLRIGSHAGNRFSIRLRQVEGDVAQIESRLALIGASGVPNYFGEQRFGHAGSNIAAVSDWFAGGSRPRDHQLRSLLLSTARAVLFNELLSMRVTQGSWNDLLPGDMMNLQGSERCFAALADDPALPGRLQQLDIHPTGALWGRGLPESQDQALALERAVAEANPLLSGGLEARGLSQARRSLRLWPQQLHYARLEEMDWLLQFTLPRGSYATVVLRELCSYRDRSQAEAGQL